MSGPKKSRAVEIVSIDYLRELIVKYLVLVKKGVSEDDARIISDVLMYATLRGNNQGLAKIKDMKFNYRGPISVTHETNISCLINGNYNHSMIVLEEAARRAVKKARRERIGVVGTYRTNTSSGAIGYFTSKIAEENKMVAILCATTKAIVAPFGGIERSIGTNPISFAFPTGGKPIVFDATTAACAYYALVEAAANNREVPAGFALDGSGQPTVDPQEAMKGALLPRSLFGWGMGVVVQLLAGPFVSALKDANDENNWGHFLMVIDPEVFGDREEFMKRVRDFASRMRNVKPLPGVDKIYLPGDRGNDRAKKILDHGKIEVDKTIYDELFGAERMLERIKNYRGHYYQ